MHIDQKTKDKVLENLATLGGAAIRDDDVLFEGNKFVVPAALEGRLKDAAKFLLMKEQEDEAETSFSRTFKYRPWDGYAATVRAFEKAFGAVLHKRQPGFFGSTPPELRSIPVGVDEFEQVPVGPVEIPLLQGCTIYPDQTRDPEHGLIFSLAAVGPRKYRGHIEGIFNLVEDELQNNSIYRGKAFDGKDMPDFLDLRGVDPSKTVFPEETLTQLDASVFANIRYPDQLRALGIGGKRAVLLHGPFGTGKTSTGRLVAKEAIANDRTFVMAKPGRDDLADVFRTARLYQPSVVFFEDLDTVASSDDQMDITKLLDMFDGFTSKDTDILAILTTNYPDKIKKGMIRPGRLDALIYLGAPDAAGVEKLVKLNIPEELLANVDWGQVAESMQTEENDKGIMEHYLPAFIAEVAQGAVRYSVVRNNGENGHEITTEDLVGSAEGMRPHWDMMQDAPETTPADSVGVALEKVVKNQVESVVDRTRNDQVGDIRVIPEDDRYLKDRQ